MFFQDELRNIANLVIDGLWTTEMQVKTIKQFLSLMDVGNKPMSDS